jgi:ABC-type uncharacterized transport system permease subunit
MFFNLNVIYAKCHFFIIITGVTYAKFHVSITILSVLNVIVLSVAILIVVAPRKQHSNDQSLPTTKPVNNDCILEEFFFEKMFLNFFAIFLTFTSFFRWSEQLMCFQCSVFERKGHAT